MKLKKQRKGMEDILKKVGKVRKNGKRVERVFNRAMEEVASGKDINKVDLNLIQREEGYSEESIRCGKVFQTKTWEKMKGKDLETFVALGFLELASPSNDDKRTRTKNLENMATLNDMWPGKKMKFELTNEATSKYFND